MNLGSHPPFYALCDHRYQAPAKVRQAVLDIHAVGRLRRRELRRNGSQALGCADTQCRPMLRSLYGLYRRTGNEDLPTFEAALAPEADRRLARLIPAVAYFPAGLLDTHVSKH